MKSDEKSCEFGETVRKECLRFVIDIMIDMSKFSRDSLRDDNVKVYSTWVSSLKMLGFPQPSTSNIRGHAFKQLIIRENLTYPISKMSRRDSTSFTTGFVVPEASVRSVCSRTRQRELRSILCLLFNELVRSRMIWTLRKKN